MDTQLIPFYRAGKWGFCNPDKKIVVNCIYETVRLFHEGMAAVELRGNYGFINSIGDLIIACEYDSVTDFSAGLTKVNLWSKYDRRIAVLDNKGNILSPFIYDIIGDFREGYAKVLSGDCNSSGEYKKWGYIDTTGKEVIPCNYDDVNDFSEGMASVVLKEINSYRYKETDYFVREPSRRYGFINKNGEEVIPLIYEDAESFINGLARVKLYDIWRYIDKNGTQYWED